MKARDIKILSEVEHCLKRPNVYIGSVSSIKEQRYVFDEKTNSLLEKRVEYVPGLVKIVEEIFDNSVDAFVDNNLPKGAKVKIDILEDHFIVEDNGPGIPNKLMKDQNGEEKYACEIAWGTMRAGSNFNDTERKSAGAHGMGSYLTNIFSKEFIGENKNGGKKVIFKCSNNSLESKRIVSSTSQTGVRVTAYPDFSRFSVKRFRESEILMIKTRIVMLAMSYPEIKFIFNGNEIKTRDINF